MSYFRLEEGFAILGEGDSRIPALQIFLAICSQGIIMAVQRETRATAHGIWKSPTCHFSHLPFRFADGLACLALAADVLGVSPCISLARYGPRTMPWRVLKSVAHSLTVP